MHCVESTDTKIDAANDAQYGIEALCAGYNLPAASDAKPVEAVHEGAAELAVVEIQAFLTRFYRFQQG
jgi:hypothetical protein